MGKLFNDLTKILRINNKKEIPIGPYRVERFVSKYEFKDKFGSDIQDISLIQNLINLGYDRYVNESFNREDFITWLKSQPLNGFDGHDSDYENMADNFIKKFYNSAQN